MLLLVCHLKQKLILLLLLVVTGINKIYNIVIYSNYINTLLYSLVFTQWNKWSNVSSLGLSGSNSGWLGLATSSTGQYLVVCSGSKSNVQGGLYVSSNYGASWTQSSLIMSCVSVTSSSSGQYLAACTTATPNSESQIFLSSSYGTTWTSIISISSNQVWQIASDSTGKYLIAASGSVCLSSNYGTTWTSILGAKFWFAAASDSTGKYLGVIAYVVSIKLSSDYGSTWASQTIDINLGTVFKWPRMVIVGSSVAVTSPSTSSNGGIYISSTFGDTWMLTAFPASWVGIAADNSFTNLIAAVEGGSIYWSSTGMYTLSSTGFLLIKAK